jgi:hypothetical protein
MDITNSSFNEENFNLALIELAKLEEEIRVLKNKANALGIGQKEKINKKTKKHFKNSETCLIIGYLMFVDTKTNFLWHEISRNCFNKQVKGEQIRNKWRNIKKELEKKNPFYVEIWKESKEVIIFN